MPKFYKTKEKALKKSNALETTSHATPDSPHGGFYLNEEVDDSSEEEVRDGRPTGRDKDKKKTSSASIPSESSVATPLFVDRLVDKWKNIASGFFSKKKEAQESCLEMKHQQMELEEKARQQQMELEKA